MAVSRILKSGWRFKFADDPSFAAPSFDDSAWQPVTIPHDWAVRGPFDKKTTSIPPASSRMAKPPKRFTTDAPAASHTSASAGTVSDSHRKKISAENASSSNSTAS